MARRRAPQMVTSSVESISMAFYTDDEVRSMSMKEITTAILFDNLGRPVPGGLFDAAMGPWKDEPGNCKTCGEPSLHCPGHCGHINLVLPVYNPLLFKTLLKLLRQTCFYCNHLMINRERVRVFNTKLELIVRGDVIHARNIDSLLIGGSNANDKDKDIVAICLKESSKQSPLPVQHSWTSLQCCEAKSVFKAIMTDSNGRKCGNCGAKNPKIVSPGFGLLYKEALTDTEIKSNFMRASKVDLSFTNSEENKCATNESQTGDFCSEPSGGEVSDNIIDGEQHSISESQKNLVNKLPHEFWNQKGHFSKRTYMTPLQVQHILRLLWQNEHQLFSVLWTLQPKVSTTMKNRSFTMFFLQALLVPPSRFRPPNEINTSPQNIVLGKVLQSNMNLADALKDMNPGDSISLQNLNRWIQLQEAVNVLFDSSKATSRGERSVKGICQILEKKDGIFRQNMMGKRVNFACRSVISPDPYLAVNEIGIPPYFALRLTYPEKVTSWNADRLRKAILNGPYVYPGAVRVEDEQGVTHLDRPATRRAIAKKLSSSSVVTGHHRLEGKVVHRHLQDGDILLVNRQPTLHKPSMMAHVARVLKGEKTLRMHYANCSTYNADFDGDEMNVHFPQDEIARAEAYNIVNANEQYIVPTKGEPIRGLIQDHIASSVLLTKKDTFLTREEYHFLLYSACAMAAGPINQGESCRKSCVINSEGNIHPILPAIWKPFPLWTGKQVITTILNHVTHGRPPLTVENEAKIYDHNVIPKGCEGDANTLHRKCLISKNEFLYGVIDKAQYGKYGLVHIVQELYGSNTAGLLLSILSRLFTAHLQMHGFTCGVDDLLLVREAEILRIESINKCESIGESVHSKFIGVEDGKLDPISLRREIENVLRINGESATERLDALMSSELNELTNELNKKLFPCGLLKPFPNNCVFLMTASGAKGSNVNFIQISSLLGQQELEGKRVPRMVSGKTLPCFPPWDTAPRAGGFISDRFLTGLHPQEYYFHCMAGRDGLVDTAIKTSRSGYLQRCLIKNLECLKVCYDYTVRDADGSIVQFYYGEDGVDVLKSSCLTEFKILAANQEILLERLSGHSVDSSLFESNGYISCLPDLLQRKAERFVHDLSEDQKKILMLRKPKKFMNLLKLKYISSLAHAGEAVGVIAAQSIGEPSTQMTLNTFHLAGRGEGNVTLGMPRLREILMTASKNILTPLVTCPLLQHKTMSDAECIAAKLKRIRFSDIIESMDVRVVPFFIERRVVLTVYKLKVNLCGPDMYPPHANISEEECEDVFKNKFVPLLKKAIDKYLEKMSKSCEGIEVVSEHPEGNYVEKTPEENEAGNESGKGEREELDEDEGEDEGADAQKRKSQSVDDIEYDDEMENEMSGIEDVNSEEEKDEMVDTGKEGDQIEVAFGTHVTGADSEVLEEALVDVSKNQPTANSLSISKPSKSSSRGLGINKLKSKSTKSLKNLKSNREKKIKTDAHIIVAAGSCLEVHFCISNGTYLLLSQFAEKVAMNVYIRTVEGIDDCSLILPKGHGNKTKDQLNRDRKNKKHFKNMPEDLQKKTEPIKLQTRGVNFLALWRMQDHLDITKLYSNDINAVLETYGVEAARATIVAEIRAVFERYGIRPDIRHLNLIADFMTFDGQYRPMNRYGISSSASPFLKITFETATNFIVEMASHGEVEPLESPSARIAIGQPVKLGTGCFDLLQKL